MVCSIYYLQSENNSNHEDGYRFSDEYTQKLFIRMLTENNIEFRQDEDGYIWYKLKYEKKVKNIKGEILKKYYSTKYSLTYQNINTLNYFIDALNKNLIKYKVIKQGGVDWVHWNEEDDASVQSIIKEVNKYDLDMHLKK